MEDLGRLFTLDMLLGNPDRLPCAELGWRGNPGARRGQARRRVGGGGLKRGTGMQPAAVWNRLLVQNPAFWVDLVPPGSA